MTFSSASGLKSVATNRLLARTESIYRFLCSIYAQASPRTRAFDDWEGIARFPLSAPDSRSKATLGTLKLAAEMTKQDYIPKRRHWISIQFLMQISGEVGLVREQSMSGYYTKLSLSFIKHMPVEQWIYISPCFRFYSVSLLGSTCSLSHLLLHFFPFFFCSYAETMVGLIRFFALFSWPNRR